MNVPLMKSLAGDDVRAVIWGGPHFNHYGVSVGDCLYTGSNRDCNSAAFNHLHAMFPHAVIVVLMPAYYEVPDAKPAILPMTHGIQYSLLSSNEADYQPLCLSENVQILTNHHLAAAATVDVLELLKKVTGRLFFAGEYTCTLSYSLLMAK